MTLALAALLLAAPAAAAAVAEGCVVVHFATDAGAPVLGAVSVDGGSAVVALPGGRAVPEALSGRVLGTHACARGMLPWVVALRGAAPAGWWAVGDGNAAVAFGPATEGLAHDLVDAHVRRTPLALDVLDAVEVVAAGRGARRATQVTPAGLDRKLEVASTLTLARYEEHIKRLSGEMELFAGTTLTTRSTMYDGSDVAADFLKAELEAYGYEDVVLDAFVVRGKTTHNVMARKVGRRYPDEIIVVGGHFDSTSETPRDLAPGAEDNGSGTALMLLLAEAFAEIDLERTVHFIGFSGEEQGLYGSKHHALVTSGVQAALTFDMVSFIQTRRGVLIEGTTAYDWLMQLVKGNVEDITTLDTDLSYHSFGSDHTPYQARGIAAVLHIDLDWDDYPSYHRSTDTFDKLDTSLGFEIARASVGSLYDLAGLFDGEDLPSATRSQRPAAPSETPTPWPVAPSETPTPWPVAPSETPAAGPEGDDDDDVDDDAAGGDPAPLPSSVPVTGDDDDAFDATFSSAPAGRVPSGGRLVAAMGLLMILVV